MPHDIKQQKLGRGLSALFNQQAQKEVPIPSVKTVAPPPSKDRADTPASIQMVPIHMIVPSPFQPRQIFRTDEINELAASIKKNGLLQPLVCRKKENDQYELVAGERRLRAVQSLEYETIPVIERAYTDKEVMAAALVENIQRENLSTIEEAEGYKQLIDSQYTQEEIAQVVGKSRSHVANMLRLLQLPDFVRKGIISGQLTGGHAKVLVGLDEEILNQVMEVFSQKKLSVRQMEQLIRRLRKKEGPTQNQGTKKAIDMVVEATGNDDIEQLTHLIQEKVKVPVQLNINKNEINLTLTFQDYEKLDTFLSQLSII